MTVDLSEEIAGHLRDLAERQGRDVETVLAEAVRGYLLGEAITDLEPAEVARTQERLLPEIVGPSSWSDSPEQGSDETR